MSWHYVERTENDILISVKVNDESHATVCTVYGSTSPMNDQYVGASRLTRNVKLICAAPDLLDALQLLIMYADDSEGCQYGTLSTKLVREIAQEAIAKALA